jgi:hypothetical protein
VDGVHGSAVHDDRCAACCEVHTNFADESACLTADKFQNELVTIHRSQESAVLSTRRYFSQLIVF